VGALLRPLIKKIAFVHAVPSLSAGKSNFRLDRRQETHVAPLCGKGTWGFR
jgi:hypothetical protein